MIGKKLISATPISNIDAKDYLEKLEKDYKARDKELGYELEQSLKYAKKHSKLTKKEYTDMHKELKKLELPENIIIELLNIRPTQEEVIRSILFKKVNFDESLIKSILEIMK